MALNEQQTNFKIGAPFASDVSVFLANLGISASEIVRNPSYDMLYRNELDENLQGCERGILTKTGAVNVDTGVFTGRSPKDKYIVKIGRAHV